MSIIGQHQQSAFTNPQDGQTGAAAAVLGNDNAVATSHNAHDNDASIHIQSSVLASRPAFGTAPRFWFTTDTGQLWYDSGAAWVEVSYLPLTGGTLTGPVGFGAGAGYATPGAYTDGTYGTVIVGSSGGAVAEMLLTTSGGANALQIMSGGETVLGPPVGVPGTERLRVNGDVRWVPTTLGAARALKVGAADSAGTGKRAVYVDN